MICRSLAVVAMAACLASPLVLADAEVAKPQAMSADFSLGFDAVQAKDWDTAVYHLAIVARDEPTNADAQNLLGYAYRNQKKYDLAFKHYGAALKIDPSHKGAHEYIGEAYVIVGNKAKAQEHLAALERICGKGCEAYQDLAKAIAQAK